MRPETHSTILEYVVDDSQGARHATLIDPANQTPDVASQRAQIAIEAGSKLIMVGGSTNTPDEQVHATICAIQESLELRIWGESQGVDSETGIDWNIPVVLFPGAAHALSPAADAITFMMLMNSEDPSYLIGEQKKGATYLATSNVETLSTGYLVCSPGGKVGEIGKANLVQPDDVEGVQAWANCARMYGFKLFYLEAGSGAESPISKELISTASNVGDLTIFVGGGINTPSSAKSAVEAGADWIVTGTLTENCSDLNELRSKIADMITTMNQSSS